MVKYFLKNSDQEVKIGDEVIVSVPVQTPYGGGKYEAKVLVNQESLSRLIKDGLIEVKGEKEPVRTVDKELYKPFIRRLARRLNVPFSEALNILDVFKDTSMYAHNCLLLELMAEVMNRGKTPEKFCWIIDLSTGKPMMTDSGIGHPCFLSPEDAKKASFLITPFVNGGK